MSEQLLSLETGTEDKPQEQEGGGKSSALEALVGEDKKFKTVEDLAKSKADTDAQITQIVEDNRELRRKITELENKANTSKFENEISDIRNELSQRKSEQEPKETTPPQLVTGDLEKMIDTYVTKREATATAKTNVDQTNAKLVELYGDPVKAQEEVSRRAGELGVSVQDLTQMAAKSPTAVLALFSTQQQTSGGSISKESSVQGIPNNLAEADSKEALDKLRRENPSQYWTQGTMDRIAELKKQGKY